MADQLHYLKLAEACLQVARSSSDPENQKLLLAMANDYLTQAKKASQGEKIGHPTEMERRVLN